jgi:hypothetical protein
VAHFSLVIIGSGSGSLVVPEDGDRGPVAPIEHPRIITGADAGERGGWPDKSLCHEGEDNVND